MSAGISSLLTRSFIIYSKRWWWQSAHKPALIIHHLSAAPATRKQLTNISTSCRVKKPKKKQPPCRSFLSQDSSRATWVLSSAAVVSSAAPLGELSAGLTTWLHTYNIKYVESAEGVLSANKSAANHLCSPEPSFKTQYVSTQWGCQSSNSFVFFFFLSAGETTRERFLNWSLLADWSDHVSHVLFLLTRLYRQTQTEQLFDSAGKRSL